MQLTAVDVTGMADVAPGDAIYLLGGEGPHAITANDVAEWWGTIPYEVFCLFGLTTPGTTPKTGRSRPPQAFAGSIQGQKKPLPPGRLLSVAGVRGDHPPGRRRHILFASPSRSS